VAASPATPRAASILTVGELAESYITEVAARLKATTVRIYRNDLDSLCKGNRSAPLNSNRKSWRRWPSLSDTGPARTRLLRCFGSN
jgi:hypothetical protein